MNFGNGFSVMDGAAGTAVRQPERFPLLMTRIFEGDYFSNAHSKIQSSSEKPEVLSDRISKSNSQSGGG